MIKKEGKRGRVTPFCDYLFSLIVSLEWLISGRQPRSTKTQVVFNERVTEGGWRE